MPDLPILGTRLDGWVRLVLLWLVLVIYCVVGLITPYIVGVIGILLFVALLVRGRLLAAYGDLAARLFFAAFVALGLAYAITAQQSSDVLRVFNFTALLLFAPLLALMQGGTHAGASRNVARLAAAGAAAALAVAVIARYGLGFERADTPLIGAIVLGNTAILLGFLAVPGVLAAPAGPRRWLYAIPPLLGVATASITASRGPMLAIAPLVILCAIVIARRFKVRPAIATLGTIGYLALCALILFGLNDRLATLLGIAESVAGGEVVDDTNAALRLALYEAGFRAFFDAPLFGHGWARLMTAVAPYITANKSLTAEWQVFALNLPQLHNDVVNMAVAAGVVGIAVYALLIATPLVAAWRSPRDEYYAFRLFGVAILCTAYVFDGLTDLMFGFEFHTMLYVALTAILLGYCREPRPASA